MDWNSIIGGATGGSSVTLMLVVLIYGFRKSLSTLLNKALLKDVAKYQQALEEKTEYLKHDLQKDILNAQITTSQRHEIYAEMHKRLVIAMDLLISLNKSGLKIVQDYSKESIDVIEEILDSIKCPQSEKEKVLTEFERDSSSGNTLVQESLYSHRKRTAEKEIQAAINHYRVNELYMTEPVADKVNEALKTLKRLESHYSFKEILERGGAGHKSIDDESVKTFEKEVQEHVEQIKSAMRKEINKG